MRSIVQALRAPVYAPARGTRWLESVLHALSGRAQIRSGAGPVKFPFSSVSGNLDWRMLVLIALPAHFNTRYKTRYKQKWRLRGRRHFVQQEGWPP